MFQTTTLSDIAPGTPPIIPALSPWYQSGGGTIFIEGTAPAGGAGVPFQFENGTDTERVSIERSGNTVSMRARTASNASLVNQSLGTVADGGTLRAAMAFKQGSFKGCLNGGTIYTAGHPGSLPTLSQFRIGNNVAASSAFASVSRIQYFPYFMSDAEIQAVTNGRWPFVLPSLSLNFGSTIYSVLRLDRTMTARIAAEVEGPQIRPFGAVKYSFASGTLALNTTPYTITIGGVDYLGVGSLGEVTNVEESSEMKAQKIALKMTGLSPEIVAIALGEHYQGVRTVLYLGFLDADHALLDTPIIAFSGQLDTMDIRVGTEAEITATIESRFADWERPRVRRFTDADQQDLYPGDKGLEFVSKVTDMELVWGTG